MAYVRFTIGDLFIEYLPFSLLQMTYVFYSGWAWRHSDKLSFRGFFEVLVVSVVALVLSEY